MRPNPFSIINSSFSIVYGKRFYVFSSAKVKIYNRVIVADEHLAYKMIYYLLLIVFVVYVAFQYFFYKRQQILFCNFISSLYFKLSLLRFEVI